MAQENGSDLSQRIMRSAKDLFFTRGYAKTQLRAIARNAGSSESGVLRLYHSKNGVIRAVYASCWKELNDQIDRGLAEAVRQDSDPRNQVTALVRAILEGYQANPAMFGFLISHFGIRDTNGLVGTEESDPAVDQEVRDQYHRYLERFAEVCAALTEQSPALGSAGVTPAALAEVLISIVYGVQTSWHMAELDEDATRPPIPLEDVLATLRFFLYPQAHPLSGQPE